MVRDGRDKRSENSEFLRNIIYSHGLWTPNEGINQKYLKNWADVADKIHCKPLPCTDYRELPV